MKLTPRLALIGAVLALATACSTSPSTTPGATAGSPSPSASAPPGAGPASSPSPGQQGGASTAARAVARAARTAEAQALGVTPEQLTQALRQGRTVQQLAGGKSMDQAAFQSAFTQKLKPRLDQLVQQGTLTLDQAQKTMIRLTQKIPNWDRAPKPRSSPAAPASPAPSPSPTPSSSPASQ